MKVVIVGGASAAARIRRLDEHAQIIMIERSGYVSYANCGLPYYVGGVIKEQEELTLQTPESFWDRFRIDVRVRQEVTAINPTEKTVTVHALDSGKVYTETYDKLLLAPGAKPTVPALSGVSSERVFTLRTVEDTLRIRRFVEDQKPKTAVLAGGGFIGLEMAENLVEMGVSVTIVQRLKQLLAPLDADMASFVHAEMRMFSSNTTGILPFNVFSSCNLLRSAVSFSEVSVLTFSSSRLILFVSRAFASPVWRRLAYILASSSALRSRSSKMCFCWRSMIMSRHTSLASNNFSWRKTSA